VKLELELERFRHRLLSENGAEKLARIAHICRSGAIPTSRPRAWTGREFVIRRSNRATVANGSDILRLLRCQPSRSSSSAEAKDRVHGVRISCSCWPGRRSFPAQIVPRAASPPEFPPRSLLMIIDPIKIECENPRPNASNRPSQVIWWTNFIRCGWPFAGGGQEIQAVVVPAVSKLTDSCPSSVVTCSGLADASDAVGVSYGAQRDALAQLQTARAQPVTHSIKSACLSGFAPGGRRSDRMSRKSTSALVEGFKKNPCPSAENLAAGLCVLHTKELISDSRNCSAQPTRRCSWKSGSKPPLPLPRGRP